jgi:hypothetical protein
MGSFGDYAENKILDHVFGKATFTPPTIYVALSSADPTDAGTGLTEPSGGGYARVATAAGDWNTAASGAIDNANDIQFPTATAAWSNLSHFALMDAASGGNLIGHGTITGGPITVAVDETARFKPGDLDVTLD